MSININVAVFFFCKMGFHCAIVSPELCFIFWLFGSVCEIWIASLFYLTFKFSFFLFLFFVCVWKWMDLDIHLWAMWLRWFEARTQNQCLYQGHESCCDAMHPNCSNDCKLYWPKEKEKKIIRRKKQNKNITKMLAHVFVFYFFRIFPKKKFHSFWYVCVCLFVFFLVFVVV